MTGALDKARAALRSVDFRFLLGARLSSQFADGVFQGYLVDTIVFLNPEKQGTVVGVAKAFVVLVIPFSLVGPFTGVVIDRWSRRRILIWTPLIRAVVAAGLLLFAPGRIVIPMYVLALIVLSADRFYLATAGAVMPVLVPEEDLLVGNSLASATGTVVTFLGLVVGTQLADLMGARGLIGVCVAAWPLSGLLAQRIQQPLRAVRPGADIRAQIREATSDLLRGARRLGATPAALGSIVSISLDQFLIGLVTVLSVVVFKQEFKEGVASYGRILGAGGVGVLVGTITVGWLEERLAKPHIMVMSFAVAGAVALAGSPRIVAPVILLISFTLGLTFPWKKVPADTIVQESIPDRFLGRVFALYDFAYSLPRVAAAGLAIPLIPHLSAGWIVALTGFIYLLWTPVPSWWVRRPVKMAVRFYSGGRADEAPRAIVVGGEEEPVEVLRSWNEERAGTRRRHFQVSTQDGWIVDLFEDTRGRWRVERTAQRNSLARESGQ